MAGKKYTREKYENPEPQSDIAKFIDNMNKVKEAEGLANEEHDSFYAFRLTKSNLEDAISVGMSKKDLLIIFHVNEQEMDKWCMTNYHNMRFKEVYEWCLLIAQKEYRKSVVALAERGNPQALQQAMKFVLDMDSGNTSRVVFVNDIPKKNGE